jgi:hypothetical protein
LGGEDSFSDAISNNADQGGIAFFPVMKGVPRYFYEKIPQLPAFRDLKAIPPWSALKLLAVLTRETPPNVGNVKRDV